MFDGAWVFGHSDGMKLLLACAWAATTWAAAAAVGPSPDGWKFGTPDAVVRHDWARSIRWQPAKHAYIRQPFAPPQDWSEGHAVAYWVHVENPAAGATLACEFPSENPATQGPDYYGCKLPLDWSGWKRVVLPFAEMGQSRAPVGLKQITGVTLRVAGADAKTVLRLGGFELVTGKAAGPRMSDAELFANLNLDLPALAAVKSAVSARNLPAAKAALAAHFRNRTLPRWTVDWRQPEFRSAQKKPTRDPRAEKVLQHKFDYTQGPHKKGTLDFGKQIDWTANPTEGEARTHLWNESLNRHFHFRALADAYWRTGQDKYAQEIADEIMDWARANPAVLLSNGNHMQNGCEAWQTLTTSIRLADVWPNAIYRCLGSPAFTDEVLCTLYKSVCEQARHLLRWPSGGNWLTSESNGLFTSGVMFPEFKEAAEWRRTGIARLYRQLDDEVYPDGMEYELAAGYNNWVVAEFAGIIEQADRNGVRAELPTDFLAKMEKMFSYLTLAALPNGALPGLNDSHISDVRKLLATGFQLFPQRNDFQYLATGRQAGRPPAETSRAFPYCGHYVMRSGWDPEATYLLFDAGPYGYGHQHEDKLHFILWSHGRQLLLDAGTFSYDKSRWRRYVLGSAGHNTVLVDGAGQHRNGQRDTYFWPRPWTAAAPPQNDARWQSTPEFDWASGIYTNGYGAHNEIAVTHQRQILFLKPERLFVVFDTLTPQDARVHKVEALFHFDAPEAVVEASTKAVLGKSGAAANIVIRPVDSSGLAVTIVKGTEEEPVQGWANDPWRAVPTAIFSKSGTGVVNFCFVVEPVGAGAVSRLTRVEPLAGGARLTLTGGATLEARLAPEPLVKRSAAAGR
jgi:hypothetical protein